MTDLGSFARQLPLSFAGADVLVCWCFSECDFPAARLVNPFLDSFGLQEEVFSTVHHDLGMLNEVGVVYVNRNFGMGNGEYGTLMPCSATPMCDVVVVESHICMMCPWLSTA